MTERAVFFGSSNVAGNDKWPAILSLKRGWVMHNFAVGGAAYTSSTNSFEMQVARALNMTDAERAEVTHVFFADSSNDARANATYAAVYEEANKLYHIARVSFPNARLVVLPVIWPSDTARYAPSQFPYNPVWNAAAIRTAHAQKDALFVHWNTLFLDESWTWLTGHDEYMLDLNDVHPGPKGHQHIARIVDHALNGGTYQHTERWCDVPMLNGWDDGASNWGRPLMVKRDGWDVQLEGAVKAGVNCTGTYVDIGTVPYGSRPTYMIPIAARYQGSREEAKLELYPSGILRLVHSNATAGTGIYTSARYRLG